MSRSQPRDRTASEGVPPRNRAIEVLSSAGQTWWRVRWDGSAFEVLGGNGGRVGSEEVQAWRDLPSTPPQPALLLPTHVRLLNDAFEQLRRRDLVSCDGTLDQLLRTIAGES